MWAPDIGIRGPRWLLVGRSDPKFGPKTTFTRTFWWDRALNFTQIPALTRPSSKFYPNFTSDLKFSGKNSSKTLKLQKKIAGILLVSLVLFVDLCRTIFTLAPALPNALVSAWKSCVPADPLEDEQENIFVTSLVQYMFKNMKAKWCVYQRVTLLLYIWQFRELRMFIPEARLSPKFYLNELEPATARSLGCIRTSHRPFSKFLEYPNLRSEAFCSTMDFTRTLLWPEAPNLNNLPEPQIWPHSR
jgi:hypothetical protein